MLWSTDDSTSYLFPKGRPASSPPMTPARLLKFYVTMFDDQKEFKVRRRCSVHARRCEASRRKGCGYHIRRAHVVQVHRITDIGEGALLWFEDDVIVNEFNKGGDAQRPVTKSALKKCRQSLLDVLTAAEPTVRFSVRLEVCWHTVCCVRAPEAGSRAIAGGVAVQWCDISTFHDAELHSRSRSRERGAARVEAAGARARTESGAAPHTCALCLRRRLNLGVCLSAAG